ncbi:MAG: GNAT family N-acetyltransferase [Clostridiales bacterium]|nr:GNAT family N-acetyltransferase [Clostridiales bacterium]
MSKLTVVPYTPDHAARWDDFVLNHSANGTFLQSRRFLSYHPQGRFTDASVMVLEGQELVAAVPAAEQMIDGQLWLRSHPGSTFGGPVIAPALLRAPKLVEMIEALDDCWVRRYAAAELKITSDLFASLPTDALQYALYHAGYTDELEIAAYLPLCKPYDQLRADYSFNKRYDLKKCEKAGYHDAPIPDEAGLSAFYDLLCLNLQKFDAKPVHTLSELRDFVFDRLAAECAVLGVYNDQNELCAGAFLFFFAQTNVLHTQYLATHPAARGVSTCLYDSVIRAALSRGCAKVSFGTSTHDRGRVLNTGLIQNKEGYGALHSLNRIYTRRYKKGGQA